MSSILGKNQDGWETPPIKPKEPFHPEGLETDYKVEQADEGDQIAESRMILGKKPGLNS